MKTINLIMLNWLVVLAPLAAQENPSPGIHPSSVELDYAVHEMPDKRGYELPYPDAEIDPFSGGNGPAEVAPDTIASRPDEAIDPVVADALFMYPNPTSGMVQVKLFGKISIQIYTISGQLVKKYYMAPGEKFLDLSDLPGGMYQVRAKSDEDYYSGKLLIQ